MDISRKLHGQIKIQGIKEEFEIESMPITQLFGRFLMILKNANIKSVPDITIRMTTIKIDNVKDDPWEGLDLSSVQVATPEMEESWLHNPRNTEGPDYDSEYALYFEYQFSGQKWETLDQATKIRLVKHMEDNYTGSKYWTGDHRY